MARLLSALRDRVVPRLVPPYQTPHDTWTWAARRLEGAEVIWPTTYSRPAAGKWLGHLRAGLEAWVRVTDGALDWSHDGPIEHLKLRSGDRWMHIAVDYADKASVDPAVLGRVDLYFKMQYRAEGYGSDRVVPGGFVPAGPYVYHAIPRLRRLRAREAKFDVYGRFSLEYATGIRRRALELLQRQRRFSFVGSPKTISYAGYLQEAASAAICIDLPGNGDFCFRLVDYMAAGCFVVGVRPRNVLPVPLEGGRDLVFIDPDLSDLVEVCSHYLDNVEERERIGRNARDYFDRYLHRDQLAAYYLWKAAERLGGEADEG